MESLVAKLLMWIALNTQYDTTQILPPDIQLLSPEVITAEYYLEVKMAIPKSGVDDRVLALYRHEENASGTIFLLNPNLNPNFESENRLPTNSVVTSNSLKYGLAK